MITQNQSCFNNYLLFYNKIILFNDKINHNLVLENVLKMKLNAKLYLKIIGILLVLTPFIDLTLGSGAEEFMKGMNSVKCCGYESEFINIIPKKRDNVKINIASIDGEIVVNELNTTITTKEPLDIYPFYIWPVKLILGFVFITSLILIFLIIRRLIYNRLLEKGTPKSPPIIF